MTKDELSKHLYAAHGGHGTMTKKSMAELHDWLHSGGTEQREDVVFSGGLNKDAKAAAATHTHTGAAR